MAFKTTRWSLIAAVQEGESTEARRALSDLCEAYWYPLYAFVRLQGHRPEEARDLTQGYFATLLDREYLGRVDPSAGRFRTYLITTLRHFLINEAERSRALKRGGGAPEISIDSRQAEDRYRVEVIDRLTPHEVFERRWALTVLERVLGRLRAEWTEAGKAERFDALKVYITGEGRAAPYCEVATQLGMTEGAVKAAVRRLRQSFGEALRGEIAETVSSASEVDDEVRYLLSVMTPWTEA